MDGTSHLNNLVFAWGGDESAIPEHEVEPFPDETRSPLLNELIRLARRYVNGMTGSQDFVWGMQRTMPALRTCIFHHKEMLPHMQLTPAQAELAKSASDALYRLLEALAQMVASFTKEDLPRVEDGIELCKDSAAVLEAWHAELAILERREYGTICNRCGHYAQPLQLACLFCHTELVPPDRTYEPEKDWIVTPNPYSKIFQGLLATTTQEASPDSWLILVDHLRDGFSTLKKTISKLTLQDDVLDIKPLLADQLFELIRACDVSRNSLLAMDEFADTGDLRKLDEAWFRMIDAVPAINKAAYQSRHTLVELLEYVSSDEYHEMLDARYLEELAGGK